MLPLRTILHPTDYSEHSAYAFQVACALARDHGARLIVLHVAEPLSAFYLEGAVIPSPEEYQEEVRERLRKIQVPDAKVVVERRLEEGDPAAGIVRVAREAGCDLIVMGTHGRMGLSRLLMGSVAEQVVRKAPCPVLTVKMPFPAAAEVAPAPEVAKV
jgi:nucleotide-binding universal stress UspA family protein